MEKRVVAKGGSFLEAPVSGSKGQAAGVSYTFYRKRDLVTRPKYDLSSRTTDAYVRRDGRSWLARLQSKVCSNFAGRDRVALDQVPSKISQKQRTCLVTHDQIVN